MTPRPINNGPCYTKAWKIKPAGAEARASGEPRGGGRPLANFTKQAIKASFIKLLNEQPLNKISVRSIVEDCGINRNSFYYHFQDIYSVLEWIVETELCVPLQFDPEQTPADWCFQALTLLQTKQAMLRKISQALGSETLYRITAKIIRPQLDRLLPEHTAQDNTTHALAQRFDAKPASGEIFVLIFAPYVFSANERIVSWSSPAGTAQGLDS